MEKYKLVPRLKRLRKIHPINGIAHRCPVEEIMVERYWLEGYAESDVDWEAIEKYKRQLQRGRYEPIQICEASYLDPEGGDPVVDGTHRLIAAHKLGMKKIKAHVCRDCIISK